MDYYERRNGSIIQIINCTSHIHDINCKSGLTYNYQTMRMISAFGPIVTGKFEFSLVLYNELHIQFSLDISGYICCDFIKCIR